MLIETHSGLRGRPGADLTDELVDATAGRLIAHLRAGGLPERVAVARDGRHSSPALADAVVDAVLARGADVVELGVLSTPGAKVAARARGSGGAVIVTGSHLAGDQNGLKLVAAPSFGPLDTRTLPPPHSRGAARGRRIEEPHAAQIHADAVCAAVDGALIRSAGITVELSGGAGDGARIALEALGCRLASPASVTLHLDADADRVQLGDERGELLDSEDTLALAACAREPALVVRSSDTSRMVDDLQARRRARVVVVAPGELYLVRALAGERDALAGEGNGGVIVPAAGPGRDGLAAGALALELVARRDRPLSELAAELPRYERRRTSVSCDPAAAEGRLAAAAGTLAVAAAEDAEAGIAVRHAGAWGLIRRSATEPVLRVTAEAASAEDADALHRELIEALTA